MIKSEGIYKFSGTAIVVKKNKKFLSQFLFA
jgi:hypothetical protein